MTKEFKIGDKVYMAYDPTISAIVEDVVDDWKHPYYVREDGSEFVTGCNELDLIDAKTAFLLRLQSLLREFDADIRDGEDYYIGFEIDRSSDKRQTIHCSLCCKSD